MSDISLPKSQHAEFVSQQAIRPEWVIDPAFLRILDDKLAIRIASIRMENLAEQSKIQARAANVQAKMFAEIAETLRNQIG